MADGISEVTNIVGDISSKVTGVGGSLLGIGAWFIIFIIILIGCGVATYLIIRRYKFNKKIVIFEKIGGKFQPTRQDRAMEVKFSTGGDTIFYLQKHKKYIPNPSLQTGARIYWYFIREDGEWINFTPGDFDEDARQVHAHFLDKEMRYARTQVQKGLKERYDKPGFWKQYGVLVFSIGFIAVLGVMMWLLFDKWIDLAATTNAGVEMAGQVFESTASKMEQIISSLDNICQGGSGYKPAT